MQHKKSKLKALTNVYDAPHQPRIVLNSVKNRYLRQDQVVARERCDINILA